MNPLRVKVDSLHFLFILGFIFIPHSALENSKAECRINLKSG